MGLGGQRGNKGVLWRDPSVFFVGFGGGAVRCPPPGHDVPTPLSSSVPAPVGPLFPSSLHPSIQPSKHPTSYPFLFIYPSLPSPPHHSQAPFTHPQSPPRRPALPTAAPRGASSCRRLRLPSPESCQQPAGCSPSSPRAPAPAPARMRVMGMGTGMVQPHQDQPLLLVLEV